MGLIFRGPAPPRLAAASRLACALLASLAPTTIVAQESEWVVMSVHVDADLTAGDGSAEVLVRYAMGTTPGDTVPMAKPIHFELLGFGDATVDRVATLLGDTVELWPTSGDHRAASLFAPEPRFGENTAVVELSYRVETAAVEEDGRIRARIPVLSGPTAPMGEEGGFTARLTLPDGWTVSEGFPSGLRMDEDGSWAVGLQVAPSMVGFRGRSDGTWRPGVPLAVDLVTLLILLGFSAIGWRHLSGVARRARA